MHETENLYIIDTSSLIELQRRYPPDIFPSVWEHIHDLAIAGRLIAPIEVKKELLEGYDILLQWVTDHDFVFRDFDDELIVKTQEVLRQFPRIADSESDKLYHADPFVVALALTTKERPQQTLIKYGIWVVTNEKGKLIGRVKRLAKISLFESMSAWNVISTYRDQKFGRFTNPGQQFELVSSHAEGWVKGGDRHCPLLASKIFSP